MEELIIRVREVINTCWESFSAKVGGGLISVNKEASMQLQYAYILKNTIDLAIHHQDELISIELETGIPTDGRMRECDIVVQIIKGTDEVFLPIEMKCYKEYAASGGKRGAVDIFFKDVYADLELLESYSRNSNFIRGIQLTLTDFRNLPFPTKRTGKYLAYDIRDGARIEHGIHLNVPIGGVPVDITLTGRYEFNWIQIGSYYFLKLENNV